MKMKAKDIFKNMMRPFKFNSGTEGSSERDLEKIAAEDQKHFSFETLSRATDKFHPSHKLGEGGFGPVFKGKLVDGREIAVKMLSQHSRQGTKEFTNEAKLLARVQHRNIVNLLGYCTRGDNKLLVYEYVSNESLDKFLFKPDKRQELNWKKRYDIITGVAKGLLYLHEHSHNCIIHRDIKASNILLNDKWVPKIADFGMARLFPEDQTHLNTRVAGTNGYMAPEYVMHGNLSVKADVYSFGVLMLELISGQRNSYYNPSLDAPNLLEWAYKLLKKGRSLEVLDPSIATTAVDEQVALCVQIGLLCTQSDPSLRPPIHRVVVLLSKRPTSLEEPTRPGLPGSRYRRSRYSGSSSCNAGTSGAPSHYQGPSASNTGAFSRSAGASSSNSGTSGASSSTKFDRTTSTMSATATTPHRSPHYDPRGKRPVG